MQNIKLSKKEVEKLKNLQDSLAVSIENLGSIAAAEIELKERKESVEQEFKNQRSSQRELATELQEKYGEGTIDLETGEFIKPE
jgi:hypothetical protein|tara:strand:+ start:484 stop:735 length:252 start_codon:yes stop_codon:yes gene_type:complete